MSCARPLIRVYNPNDHNITGSIMTLETYRERAHNPTATYESIAYRTDVMLLPCGKCLGCRLRQRQDWETRMLMESKTLTPVWFLTLTWNQEYVQNDKSNRRTYTWSSTPVDNGRRARSCANPITRGHGAF